MLLDYLPAALALGFAASAIWRSGRPVAASDVGGPLRVALFSGNYNCVSDGANQALNRLVRHLIDRHGADVRVYSPTGRRAAFAPAGRLISVPSVPFPGRGEYRLALGLPPRLRRELRMFRPDIVHLSAPDPLGEAAARFARRERMPLVISLHTRFEAYLSFYGLDWLKRVIERRLGRFYAKADYVLAPNAAIADELRRQGAADRVRLWGRGVDRSIFAPPRRSEAWRRQHGYSPEDVVILFFGRLVREKGLDEFAATIEALRDKGRQIRPLIVGDGPARDRLAARLPNVIFTGHLADANLGMAIASADILVNPSVTEAFGNVTLEAMAAGLAIVSADVASARSLLEHGRTGLLVPPADIDAYAGAVEELLDRPVFRSALASAAIAESGRYEWPAILSAVVDVYGEAMRRDRVARPAPEARVMVRQAA